MGFGSGDRDQLCIYQGQQPRRGRAFSRGSPLPPPWAGHLCRPAAPCHGGHRAACTGARSTRPARAQPGLGGRSGGQASPPDSSPGLAPPSARWCARAHALLLTPWERLAPECVTQKTEAFVSIDSAWFAGQPRPHTVPQQPFPARPAASRARSPSIVNRGLGAALQWAFAETALRFF